MTRRALRIGGVAAALSGILSAPVMAQSAQTPLEFPLEHVLDLADLAHLDRSGFLRALEQVLPVTIMPEADQRHASATSSADPFLWSLTGFFGGQGAHPRPGALLACARYGLATRDHFAEYGFTRPESFSLMNRALPQSGDADVWPDGAVARLHCSFIWDDEATVAIMAESLAVRAFNDRFAQIEQPWTDDLFGDGSYRLIARGGREDTIITQVSAQATLMPGHQQITFRSFLMGGGV